MAIHFRAKVLQPDALSSPFNAFDGQGAMPKARYLGFMLGPESVASSVVVDASDRIVLTPGSVVPCSPFEGSPTVRSTMLLPWSAVDAYVHVIGLTECHELAAAPPERAPFDWLLTGLTVPDGAASYSVSLPFRRRHALISAYVDGGGAPALSVSGVNRGKAGASVHQIVIANAVPFSDGTMTGYHIGGTDHEEPFDYLKIWLGQTSGSPANGELRYLAFGEPGH